MACSETPPSQRSLHTETIQPINIINQITGFFGATYGNLTSSEKNSKNALIRKNSGKHSLPLHCLIEKFNAFCFKHITHQAAMESIQSLLLL